MPLNWNFPAMIGPENWKQVTIRREGRIAIRFRRWPSGTVSASRRSTTGAVGGFVADDVRRLKQLEAENARLKKLVAERDLEIEVMKEVAANWWACRLAGGKLCMAGSVVSRRGGPARCSRWRDRR